MNNVLPRQGENLDELKVAYFSMEIMLENDIASYAGGLGMLAGDILRTLADKCIPAVGVTVAFNNGYTNQIIENDGAQKFIPAEWVKSDQLIKMSEIVKIQIEKKELTVGCYRYDIVGCSGFVVPVYLLTTDYFENSDDQKYFTKYLYDQDKKIRLIQEVILGIGGVRMLRALGFDNIHTFHMNDGHCSFLTLEILKEQNYEMDKTKSQCCFTTHTPVPAGRDSFDYKMAYEVMEEYLPLNIRELAGRDSLDMLQLGWSLSKYTNAVSKKHSEVSSDMFKAPIGYITNGVHPFTWTAPVTQEVYDRYLPTWRENIDVLRNLTSLPNNMIEEMHRINKRILIDHVNRYLDSKGDLGSRFDYDTLTITFARRCVEYKRPSLIFNDIERFLRIGIGKIQLIFSGKTHPEDEVAAEILKKILEYRNKLSSIMTIAYIENYNPSTAKLLVSGSDIWLNNPVIPMEASGTSGMKAALNGTINLSILDGWFIEGMEIEPNASFVIGKMPDKLYPDRDDAKDASALYDTLENEVIPAYYNNREEWTKKMAASIKLGAHFTTYSTTDEYLSKAWN